MNLKGASLPAVYSQLPRYRSCKDKQQATSSSASAKGSLSIRRTDCKRLRCNATEARLYRLLQKLEPRARQVALSKQFTERQRLALERWILSEKALTPSEKEDLSGNLKSISEGQLRKMHDRPPRSGHLGIHTSPKNGRERYCSCLHAGPFFLSTGYFSDISKVIGFRPLLELIRERVAAHGYANGEMSAGILEDSFRASLNEVATCFGQQALDDMKLRFSILVPAKYWVGSVLKTPQYETSCPQSLGAGLGAFKRLCEARHPIYPGPTNRYSILRRHSPTDLEAAWQRIRRTYVDVWAEAGYCCRRVITRLLQLEVRHRDFRKRLEDRWQAKGSKTCRMDSNYADCKQVSQTSSRVRIAQLLSRWKASRKKAFRTKVRDAPTPNAAARRYTRYSGLLEGVDRSKLLIEMAR